MKIGDDVRVLRPESLLKELQRRIVGRRAWVERIYTRYGATEPSVVVCFDPKNGRGKSFSLHMQPWMLEVQHKEQ